MSGAPGPDENSSNNGRFTTQAHTVEDRLKADTVGLVQLSDFRKRRAEALEAAQDVSSGASSPEPREVTVKHGFKKRKKGVRKGGLSFGDDEGEEPSESRGAIDISIGKRPSTVATDTIPAAMDPSNEGSSKRMLKPNAAVSFQPKAMTKSAALKEAQMKDALKKEYMQTQEAVKATELVLPFVFYDGKNVPGGTCRMKKGDPIWLFLERARKVGASLVGQGDRSRKDWARISVDDLMVVKGDIIIPHHFEFYYFIVNHSFGYQGPLFSYSAEPTATSPEHLNTGILAPNPKADPVGGLQTAAERAEQSAQAAFVRPDDSELEGFGDDPNLTKVVDRRWYERNKHVFPASSWEEFDPSKDYRKSVRTDGEGNARFFSR